VYTKFCKTADDFIPLLKMSPVFPTPKYTDYLLNNLPRITRLINFRNSLKDSTALAIIRMSGDMVNVYSNDLSLLKTVKDIDKEEIVSFTEAVVPNPEISGVKYFAQDPKHSYRVYLKNMRVDNNVLKDLENTLRSKKDELTPCRSLKAWLSDRDKNSWRSRFMYSYYYIDYDNEQMLSYLGLLHGEYLGKVIKLEKRP